MNHSLFESLSRASSLSEDAKILVDQLKQGDEVGQLRDKVDELYNIIYELTNPAVDEQSVIESINSMLSAYDKKELFMLPSLYSKPYFKAIQNKNMRRAIARALLAFSEKNNLPLLQLWQDIYINGGLV